MKKYRVGVDVDGVLADFTTPVLTIVGEMLARKVGNMKNGDLRMTSLSAVTIFYVRQTLSNNHLA